MKKLIAYYRVSTAKQGRSGLGLDAQRRAVRKFAEDNGCSIIAEFTEVESGRKDKRPELTKALAAAQREGVTLAIAKLDRLSRRASFILALRDSGVDFVACDSPHLTPLTVGILALVAQDEAERTSERTKLALAAKRWRQLADIAELVNADVNDVIVREKYRQACQDAAQRRGSTAALAAARDKATVTRKAAAAECPEWIRAEGYAKTLRAQGQSLHTIAATLNADGFVTRGGRPFAAQTIKRLLAR